MNLESNMIAQEYLWLRTSVHAWVIGEFGPVQVDVISVDYINLDARVKTAYQIGTISFENLYETYSICKQKFNLSNI